MFTCCIHRLVWISHMNSKDTKHCSVISSLRQIQLLFNNSYTASLGNCISVETPTGLQWKNKTGLFHDAASSTVYTQKSKQNSLALTNCWIKSNRHSLLAISCCIKSSALRQCLVLSIKKTYAIHFKSTGTFHFGTNKFLKDYNRRVFLIVHNR